MHKKNSLLLVHASVFVLAFSCMSFGVHAPSFAEPMVQAVTEALNNHPAVEAAIANRDALKQERQEYVSDYFPEVNVSLGSGRMYGDNSTSRGLSVTRGAGYSWVHEGSISLRQMIFDGFETMNRVDAATLRKESANFEIVDTRENLALRTVVAYMDVLRNQETLSRIGGQKRKIDDYIVRIETMVKNGVVDEAMAAQARDVRAQLQSTEASVEGTLAMAIAGYRELTGHEPQGALTRPEGLGGKVDPDVENAVKSTLQKHPALQASSLSEAAYDHDVAAERGVLFPDVSGELSSMKRDQRDLIGGESVDSRAMVRVNWTLQTGGEQIARMRKAQFRQSETHAQRMMREREIERAVRGAYADMKSSGHQLEILNDRVRLGRDLLRTQNTQFEGARITLLQLMQTDNALFNSEMSLLNGEYRQLAAQYAVLAGMGRLQETLSIVPVTAQPAHE